MATAIFVPEEVAAHDTREDCWVSIFGRVLDLTSLLAENHGELAEPIVRAAGEDVSSWFVPPGDGGGGPPELKRFVDPATNLLTPYCPAGRFIHVPPMAPTTAESQDYLTGGGAAVGGVGGGGGGGPWWSNPAYVVGRLSTRSRRVRVVNTLTSHDHVIPVAAECTVSDIQAKYLGHNAHAGAYTWKGLVGGEFRPLDMGATLDANGVEGAAEVIPAPPKAKGKRAAEAAAAAAASGVGGHDDLERLGMDSDHPDLLPVLMLYFNDDLTVA